MKRRDVLPSLIATTLSGRTLMASPVNGQSQDRIECVAAALKRMETIKPGITREDLLQVFTTEGGLSTGLRRSFVYRDCRYFKVDVEFKAIGRSACTERRPYAHLVLTCPCAQGAAGPRTGQKSTW